MRCHLVRQSHRAIHTRPEGVTERISDRTPFNCLLCELIYVFFFLFYWIALHVQTIFAGCENNRKFFFRLRR